MAGLIAAAANAMAQAGNPAPAVETIISRMEQARAENRAHLRPYQVTRDYQLFIGKETQKSKSEVIAGVSFVPPNSKKYVIEETRGGELGETVVRLMLASETELLKNQMTTDISKDNYDFRFIGQKDLEQQSCFVLELLPRRKEKNLLRGTIWVDSLSYMVRRVEGEPAKSASMWLHNLHIVLGYGDVSGMWLQTNSESTADVLLLGSHRMVSRDTDYQIASYAGTAGLVFRGFPMGSDPASAGMPGSAGFGVAGGKLCSRASHP